MINRREYLESLLIGTAAVITPSSLWSKVRAHESTGLTAPQAALLSRVCDVVIPRTRTPSASEVGVPAFVATALRHGLKGTLYAEPHSPSGLGLLAWLQDEVQTRGADVSQAIIALDAAAYVRDKEIRAWPQIKALILLGYYTSEAGATEELRYQLVPGRFDPDVLVTKDEPASANDWTALTFG